MMARGTPDGRIETNLFATQVSDVAHVNNMLWGFSPVDGRGRVMCFDTFNNGLGGWRKFAIGGGIVPTISVPAELVFSPPCVVNCNAGTTINDVSYIYREMYAGKSQHLGIEAGFSFNSGVQLDMSIDYNPVSGSPYFGRIKFNQSNGQWQIRTPGGGNTNVYAPGAPTGSAIMLIQVKLVMDFSTGKYIRLLVGDYEIDISAYSMDTSTSSYNGLLIAKVGNLSKGAGAGNMQLGYVLVTKDEP